MVDISVLLKLTEPYSRFRPVIVLVASLAIEEDCPLELDGEEVVLYTVDIERLNDGVYRLMVESLKS